MSPSLERGNSAIPTAFYSASPAATPQADPLTNLLWGDAASLRLPGASSGETTNAVLAPLDQPVPRYGRTDSTEINLANAGVDDLARPFDGMVMRSSTSTPVSAILNQASSSHAQVTASARQTAIEDAQSADSSVPNSPMPSLSGQPEHSSSRNSSRSHHPHLPVDFEHGFGVQGNPGGDCKRLCLRHQRMVDGGLMGGLQKSIEDLPLGDQEAVNSVWSLFSSSSGSRRTLILRGLLTICCPSQLSFLSEQLKAECRLDPFSLLPREICLRALGYLDAISLGRAAQVSKVWKSLADDDILWRNMCEQHIEKKCEKCGWGLPLMERRKKAKRGSRSLAMGESPSSASGTTSPADEAHDHEHVHLPGASHMERPHKRNRLEQDASTEEKRTRRTRPWKTVYCERLVIERNWRRGVPTVKVLQGHADAVTCLQVEENLPHPSFPILMTGSWDRTVRIWNLETEKTIGVLIGHTRGVRALQFDSAKLITGSMDHTLKIWSWRTGEVIRTLEGHRDAVISLHYDDKLLVSGSADSTIKVWDFSSAECFTLRGHREWVNAVRIWSPTSNPATKVEDMISSTGSLASLSTPPEDPLKLLFSASDDGTCRVWDLSKRECLRVLEGHVAQVQSLRVISIDQAVLANLTGRSSMDSRLREVDISGNDATCASAAHRIDALANGQALRHMSNLRSPVNAAMLPHIEFGSGLIPLLLSGSLDNTIKLWDVAESTCAKTLFGHVEGVWSVDMDKLRVVSASHDRTIKVWDRQSGKCERTLTGHRGAVTCISLLDDKIITGGDDAAVHVWLMGSPFNPEHSSVST
ncbi:uncharacterized protein L969DRAFT_104712 [Mixia osmundae IAM 14324]|uniref:F-box domain-containing protein n=1 Tax=Mixia osmundae (strain CBS 9802 / IAM 14324 / JCM 22182 / KY 12970) TaxID=764103 RepID=G7DWX5_MIXOS|nr:uncharacterized protein L969DRAFT_104712 [Mixia osmundae IAM 14324]KEI38118.1 hypothetical protein L969DRAFT_104712 [Mixia osmundae IAM 14324]GAA95072.1 hypothetical protein E5Q_01727 [Mixia osmundae IAM 14324]